ncbi:MAG TPA: DUF5615 family PIN-like protein [Thermoanaerobaculia bacterium]|nr:DUF5615 family PIN-like protein [Thermoanaerobaculia bacterium]
MFRLLADENFNGRILKGLLREVPDLDILRAQDHPDVCGVDDEALLAFAAREERMVLTHDAATIPRYAKQRLLRGENLSGVLVVQTRQAVGRAIEEIAMILVASEPDEWRGQVWFLPL